MDYNDSVSGGGSNLTAAFLGVSVSILLFATGLIIPLLGPFVTFLTAAPLALIRLKNSCGKTLAAIVLGTALIAVTFSPLIALWYMVQFGVTGFLVSELSVRGFVPARTILWSSAAVVVLTATLLLAAVFTFNVNPQQFVEKEIEQGMQQALKLYELPKLAEQEKESFESGMTTIAQVLLRIYPALATLNILAVSIITTSLFHRFAAKRASALKYVPFKEFRIPDILVWLLIFSGFAMLAESKLITTPALNLLLVLITVYFIQGLAIIFCLAERNKYGTLLKAFVIIILVTQPYLAMIVSAIGIFDIWGNFRIPRDTQEKNL